MACRKLTIVEYENLLLQDPNPEGYPTLEDCEGPCAGPVNCSVEWRNLLTVNVSGSLSTVVIPNTNPGTMIFESALSYWPSGRVKEYASAGLNCNNPPSYMLPSGQIFQTWNYTRYLLDQSGFTGCWRLHTFDVAIGSDGLPTRIKNVSVIATGCSSGASGLTPPPFPEITFGRP